MGFGKFLVRSANVSANAAIGTVIRVENKVVDEFWKSEKAGAEWRAWREYNAMLPKVDAVDNNVGNSFDKETIDTIKEAGKAIGIEFNTTMQQSIALSLGKNITLSKEQLDVADLISSKLSDVQKVAKDIDVQTIDTVAVVVAN